MDIKNLYLNGLIIGSINFGLPLLFTFFFYIFKLKLSPIKVGYLYAFLTGLLLMLSIFGFITEAVALFKDYYINTNQTINILIIVSTIASGLFIGMSLGILGKSIYYFKTKKQCQNHSIDLHGECVYENKIKFHDKLISIIFMFFHNALDGLILGLLLHDSKSDILEIENAGLLMGFVLHNIPTTICIYYMNYHKTNNKHKSFMFAILSNLITLPFIFLGIFISDVSNSVYWLFPLLLATSSGTLIFVTLMEFIPEYLHKHHLCTKEWLWIVIFIVIGLILGLVLSMIHQH